MATVLVAARVGLAVLFGAVVVKVVVKLAPGARLPGTVKVLTSPLLKVTVPITALAVAVALALLVKLTVAVTTEPPGALAGRSMAVVTSAKLTVTVAVELLLLRVESVVPGGGVTLATLNKLPLALLATVTWKVTVARTPLASVLLPLIAVPAPLATAVMPALGAILVIVPKPAGRVSDQLAPETGLGPLLTITTV